MCTASASVPAIHSKVQSENSLQWIEDFKMLVNVKIGITIFSQVLLYNAKAEATNEMSIHASNQISSLGIGCSGSCKRIVRLLGS
jgi:hypothetical protein